MRLLEGGLSVRVKSRIRGCVLQTIGIEKLFDFGKALYPSGAVFRKFLWIWRVLEGT